MHIHDTYFIVGHFHYVMFGGTGFAFFAALLYWFPKMFGRMYSKRAVYAAWFPLFIGFNMLYFTMLVLGLHGHAAPLLRPPAPVPHRPRGRHGGLLVPGRWACCIFFGDLLHALFKGEKAEDNPWGGVTLEWTIPSPAHPGELRGDPHDHPRALRTSGRRTRGMSRAARATATTSAPKLGMWLFLVTEMVLFGGLFIAYSYMRSRYPAEFHHGGAELNATLGVINTLVLLTSSLTMVLGIVAIQRGEKARAMALPGHHPGPGR